MDDQSRRDEREAMQGDRHAAARWLESRYRATGENELEFISDFNRIETGIRAEVLNMTNIKTERHPVLNAMVMLREQVDSALESAIQPREGDAQLPDREAILRSIHRTLTPEQALIILDRNEIHEPKLLLVPITSVDRYTEVLQEASRIMEGSQEPYLSDFTQNQLNVLATQAAVEGNKIKKWKFAITEGVQTFDRPEWDDGQATFQERIDDFNRYYSSSKMSRLDSPSYIALMNQGLRQGKPIDCKYEGDSKKRGAKNIHQYTLLNETGKEETIEGEDVIGEGAIDVVASCGWGPGARRVYLGRDVLQLRDDYARLRAAVMGDIVI